MRRMLTAAAVAAFAACFAGLALADPPTGFDARVEELRAAAGVPGMAVTIVEDGRVTLARGYGVRRLGAAERVDADTIFQLGSVGKAFTTAALAVLVDRGEIDWDDRVIDHMPWFQMHDPWVTREMTIRDLLVHRSGLGLGRRRSALRSALLAEPSGNGPSAPLHQAGDEFPQRLCLRQHPLRRGRPAHRGRERPDMGAIRT